jgi:peroxiredoxin Q/BCP
MTTPVLALGQPAPDFTLATDGGGTVSLSALRGKRVVLYFYPKDDTPGCTREACAFRDLMPDFSGLDGVVIGVSKDKVASHDKFKAKYELPFILGSDPEAEVARAYGIWVEKSRYGKTYMGMERSTFLIDRDGVIRGLWRNVKVDGHAEKVLAAARGL